MAVVPLDSRQASITRLLLTEERPSTVEAIASELNLTGRIVRYNLPSIDTYLRPEGLRVMRRRGVGVWVQGDEDRRHALLSALGSVAGPRVLDGDDRKLRVLAALLDESPRPVHIADLEEALGASRPTVRRDVRAAEAWLEGHHLHLQRLPGVGIAVRGSELDIRKGLLSLVLEAVPAEELLAEMVKPNGSPTQSAEGRGLSEFAARLDLPPHRASLTTQPDDQPVIDHLVAEAASRLHPSLAEDVQLRRSLGEHLRRLRVRLRYGLPVSNPLDHEVQQRYPDVYRVASEIVATLHPLGDAVVPHEEVSFLTMYLAGSLERNRLRPKVRITVVCPAGMATAWILVSRLSAEFPNVESTRVASTTAYEDELAGASSDLVVSTVPLDEQPAGVEFVVVSPLLREKDLRRLARFLGEPAH